MPFSEYVLTTHVLEKVVGNACRISIRFILSFASKHHPLSNHHKSESIKF